MEDTSLMTSYRLNLKEISDCIVVAQESVARQHMVV